jgi:type I restriction-modification system DNA methylase subunit
MSKAPLRNLNEYQKEFKKLLEDMAHGSIHTRDIFDDFLFMASTALRQAVHVFKTGAMDQELESSLHVLKSRYKCPNDFGKAFGCLVMALEQDQHDFLGEFYGAIEATNEKTGQFFTPSALSEACALMAFTEADYRACLARGERYSICEPAVGAGSMAIEAAKLLRQWKAHPSTYYIDATDIDLRCVRMTYIQFTLLHIPAFVRHGNTLSLEQWACWPTMAMAMNPAIPGRSIFSKEASEPTPPPPESKSTSRPLTVQGKSQPGQAGKLCLVRKA